LPFALLHQPHCALAHFRGILVCLLHGFILSRIEASSKPGAIQGACALRRYHDQIDTQIFRNQLVSVI
ncbi:hypothetical protein, partial [Burkholderia cenocepacia]